MRENQKQKFSKIYNQKEIFFLKEKLNEFYTQSKKDFELAKMNFNTICRAKYILICKINNEIVGISGINYKKNQPNFFLVVNRNHSGKGIGSKLTIKITSFSLNLYGYLILSTYENKNYQSALKIYYKLKFNFLYRKKNKIWLIKSKNRFWYLYGKYLFKFTRLI